MERREQPPWFQRDFGGLTLVALLLLAAVLAVTRGPAPTPAPAPPPSSSAVSTDDAPRATYYLNRNRQDSGDHEVHREDCRYVPALHNRVELGQFSDCGAAIREAKRRGYETADGCSFCARACDHG